MIKALDLKYSCHDRRRRTAIRVRCHVHKWCNAEAAGLFWALRDARDMADARQVSDRLESELKRLNMSAHASYLEAKDDLLVVHELKLSKGLKRFFSTTNPIESLNSARSRRT